MYKYIKPMGESGSPPCRAKPWRMGRVSSPATTCQPSEGELIPYCAVLTLRPLSATPTSGTLPGLHHEEVVVGSKPGVGMVPRSGCLSSVILSLRFLQTTPAYTSGPGYPAQ